MKKVVQLSSGQRHELFQETAARKKIKPAIAEKDFWVCWTLERLFEEASISRSFLFKGGTSLSKVFGLIDRFSEDIDLILDWRLFSEEAPEAERSKTQQDKFNLTILESSRNYIKNQLLPVIKDTLAPNCGVEVNPDYPDILNVTYPSSFRDEYLLPYIQLEIGPLSATIPHDSYIIRPYAADEFPDLFENPNCRVKAITAERTFWEKVTILHQEAHRSKEKPQPLRYSRHYYDLARMACFPVKNNSLANLELFEDVVRFKQKVYPRTWARYDLAVKGELQLIPPDHLISFLMDDYDNMREMIFGVYPGFDEIMEILKKLELEINQSYAEWRKL